MKMKKEYISPSIQVLQIVIDNILSGSGEENSFPGMNGGNNGLPSDPRYSSYDYSEEESDEAVYSKTNVWGY